jgi:ribosomal protein L35
MKTKKSALKRIKLKKKFILRKKAFQSHLLKSKNSNRLRKLSRTTTIHLADKKTYLKLILKK